jgi:hypothetical protein
MVVRCNNCQESRTILLLKCVILFKFQMVQRNISLLQCSISPGGMGAGRREQKTRKTNFSKKYPGVLARFPTGNYFSH